MSVKAVIARIEELDRKDEEEYKLAKTRIASESWKVFKEMERLRKAIQEDADDAAKVLDHSNALSAQQVLERDIDARSNILQSQRRQKIAQMEADIADAAYPISYSYTSNSTLHTTEWFLLHLAETHMPKCRILPFALSANLLDGNAVHIRWNKGGRGSIFQNERSADFTEVREYLQRKEILSQGRGYVIIPICIIYQFSPPNNSSWSHQCCLIVDLAAREMMYLDPSNFTSELSFKKALDILEKVDGVCAAMYAKLIDLKAGFETFPSIVNIQEPMMYANQYFMTHLPPNADSGYCVPLAFYYVRGIIRHWSQAREYMNKMEMSTERLMHLFIPFYVCTKVPSTHPATAEYRIAMHAEFNLAFDRKRMDVNKGGRSALRAECLGVNDSWRRFTDYSKSVVINYLEGQRAALGYSKEDDRPWYFEAVGDDAIYSASNDSVKRVALDSKYREETKILLAIYKRVLGAYDEYDEL